MPYKTLFRVLLKAIGVLLIAQSLPHVVTQGLSMLSRMAMGGISLSSSGDWIPLSWVGGYVLTTGAGVYLFFGGKWVADLALPDNRLYCAECGYQLSSRDGPKCPECGFPTGDPMTQGTL